MKLLLLTILILLTGCSNKIIPLGDVIVEKPVIVIKVIPVLTTIQKTVLSTLVTKSEATATSKNKMSYQEALDYVKALNDQTITREFKDKGLKDVMPILKSELNLIINK